MPVIINSLDDVPRHCGVCRFQGYSCKDFYYCEAMREKRYFKLTDERGQYIRQKDCPLKYVDEKDIVRYRTDLSRVERCYSNLNGNMRFLLIHHIPAHNIFDLIAQILITDEKNKGVQK